MKSRVLSLFAVAGLALLFFLGNPSQSNTADNFQWVAINVNANPRQQADAHLLRFPSGRYFLIDAGRSGEFIVPALKQRGVKRLEAVIISHVHKDHYGGLLAIQQSGIEIGTVYRNLPSREGCGREVPWGCDLQDIDSIFSTIFRLGIPVKTIQTGETLHQEAKHSLDVLAAFAQKSGEYEAPSVNDMSAVLRLSAGNRRILFTGDLDSPGGDEILRRGIDIRADVLKAPHHGCEGLVSEAFLEMVAPRWIVVPAPTNLWNQPRCRRVKDFATRHRIPLLVNAIDGDITFEVTQDEIAVFTQFGPILSGLTR
ncbi:MAG: MBL fold metallo-hydrolase [Deltaproteobacteria bacterium]|nr:MBL fold metallo-hydrolase [Deltaproteobacteria bacterium]MBI3294200.1 MBL fold metallo-hydrolase [Deltaproteobacteria bacterium]